MARKLSAKGAKAKCDVLFSKIVRARDGRCVICGSTDSLQAAHLVSRRYSTTRTDEGNCRTLCARDHLRLTDDPYAHVAWCTDLLGEDGYAALRAKALDGVNVKVDWAGELERLRAVAGEMGL